MKNIKKWVDSQSCCLTEFDSQVPWGSSNQVPFISFRERNNFSRNYFHGPDCGGWVGYGLVRSREFFRLFRLPRVPTWIGTPYFALRVYQFQLSPGRWSICMRRGLPYLAPAARQEIRLLPLTDINHAEYTTVCSLLLIYMNRFYYGFPLLAIVHIDNGVWNTGSLRCGVSNRPEGIAILSVGFDIRG